ncbi:MAG TPA: hypothetical protein VGK72_08050, partial [Chthoniobacterales bacterium]
ISGGHPGSIWPFWDGHWVSVVSPGATWLEERSDKTETNQGCDEPGIPRGATWSVNEGRINGSHATWLTTGGVCQSSTNFVPWLGLI